MKTLLIVVAIFTVLFIGGLILRVIEIRKGA